MLGSFKQYHNLYKANESERWTQGFIDWHQKWVDKTNYEVIYEDFINNRNQIIVDIAKTLNIKNYDIDNINEMLENLRDVKVAANVAYDKETLIHKGHISKTQGRINSYSEVLTPMEIKGVLSVGKEWLKKYGYEV